MPNALSVTTAIACRINRCDRHCNNKSETGGLTTPKSAARADLFRLVCYLADLVASTLVKQAEHRWKPGVMLAGGGVGLFVFVLYLITLAPTVLYYTSAMKDAPVLPVSAYVLGIPQATGYPTYMVLTHLFTCLPIGGVAYRVNLASAVFGALAVVAVFFVGLALSSRIVAAAVGALAFGVSGLFWSQAVIAEVYTLNVLFVALVVLVLLF
jgi:Protein of unknown function (DUF2723)